jgi:hypothetical protein
MRKKKLQQETPEPSRFDRFGRADLINLLESTMLRNAELFRGLSHSEIDQEWILSQLEVHAETQLGAIRALQRKVDLQTF